MKGIKKLNLLPEETKNKYLKRYLIYIWSLAGALIIAVVAVQHLNIGITTMQINSIKRENEKYNSAKENIASISKSIEAYEEFIKEHNSECFPFAEFLCDLEYYRPSGVSIISVDTKDRLAGNVKSEEKKGKDDKDDKKTKDSKIEDENGNAGDNTELGGRIGYVSDLAGQEIVIRGFGSNQDDISGFIYNITQLSYITNAKITGIEEHKFIDGNYNVFEITVVGGVGR